MMGKVVRWQCGEVEKVTKLDKQARCFIMSVINIDNTLIGTSNC